MASPTSDGAAHPAWLPDEATLNRWAGEFFSALPAGTPTQSADSVADPGAAVPAADLDAAPVPDPTGLLVPEHVLDDGVPVLPDLRGFSSGVPASVPRAEPTPAGAAPVFYFVTERASLGPRTVSDRHPAFDVRTVRRDFPVLAEQVHGRPLVWLDNAATTQKPQCVIDRLAYFYAHENSNVHRAAHTLAARSTDAYEAARRTVARFIGAGSDDEVVFVRGATEAINLVAQAWGRRNVRSGDEILVSHLEHHANLVPWQMLAQEVGALIKVIGVDDRGTLLLDDLSAKLSDRTRIVAVTHVSNALGTVTPVHEIAALAHRAGAKVLIDGAQSVPHTPIDVQAIGSDFFVFSGHKVFGPTGIGVLHGRREVLADMPPWQGGGNMITDVTLERARYEAPPGRFEAGTGNIADAVGLGAALEYLERIGMPLVASYEHQLLEYATQGLAAVPGLRLVGTADEKASVLSFVLDGYPPQDVGSALDREGIAVRAGHHCAQPILRRLGLEATVRPSLAFYNTHDEVDTLVRALHDLAARRPPSS
jgi:cysteine desulfurase/selenocysteine lyase